jgi:hypothetical protein
MCLEVNEQTNQRIRDNRRISANETVSEMKAWWKRRCKTDIRPNGKHFILMEPGNLWTAGPVTLANRAVAGEKLNISH